MSACAAAKPSSDSASTSSTWLMSFFMVLLRRMVVARLRASRLSQIAPMINAIEREPGSTWPSARSPRNEARPLDRVHRRGRLRRCRARIGARARRGRLAGAGASRRCTGSSTSSRVFWPTSALPRRVSAAMPAAQRARRDRPARARPAAPWPASPARCRTPAPTSRRWSPCRSCPCAFSVSFSELALPLVELGLDRQRAALHVQAVVAVADGAGRARSARRRGRSASAWRRGSATVWSMGRSPDRCSRRPAQAATRRPAASNQSGAVELDDDLAARLDARRVAGAALISSAALSASARCTRRWSLRISMRRTVARRRGAGVGAAGVHVQVLGAHADRGRARRRRPGAERGARHAG